MNVNQHDKSILADEAWQRLEAITRSLKARTQRWERELRRPSSVLDNKELGWDEVGTEVMQDLDRQISDQIRQEAHAQRVWGDIDGSDEEQSRDIAHRDLASAFEAVVKSLTTRDRDHVRTDFDELYTACDTVGFHDDDAFEAAEQALTLIELESSILLYAPLPPKLWLPQLLIEANDTLLRRLAQNPHSLYELSPRKFEEIIADVFWKNGFAVELTKATRDGGRDIIAVQRKLDVSLKILIECKRYHQAHKVPLAVVQRLFGVKIAEAANKAIVATTSTFTRDARVFASTHFWDLELKDYDDVVNWIRSCVR
jgi:hypothetical protein